MPALLNKSNLSASFREKTPLFEDRVTSKDRKLKTTCNEKLFDSSKAFFEKSGSQKSVPSEVLANPKIECSTCFDNEEWNVLNLERWTLVATDECLEQVSDAQKDWVRDNDSLKNLPSREGSNEINYGLNHINISGGSRISDKGLEYLSRCDGLRSVDLTNCFQITGIGLHRLVSLCNLIQILSLSGCLGIDGNGFGTIGFNLHDLKSLEISGCSQISSKSLFQIFEGCTLVEKLDVSYCGNISDKEMKVLSKNCKKLSHLNVKECNLISDVCLVELSNNCAHLASIDVSRKAMTFHITDVALLSFGDRCQDLLEVCLGGCDMITDTGICWLVQGCKNLVRLDLSYNTKISNAGIRSIGNACLKLEEINLARLKLVTDVGIRFIADGCPNLKKLNGLYLLSDGKKREFGFEGLQALARSKCTLCLADLNLGGCFRVSSLTLKSISTMKMLCRLILNGCTNITLEGMTHIAANCSQIETLSLNHCGLCVTDKMVELVASGMKKLQNMMLSGSPCIGSRSLVAISKCRFLRRLDLTNCILIDDTSLMALSEGDFIFGLHSLYLVGCKLVSNTGLTWITDGKSNLHGRSSIKMLSLKSTSVTKTGLIAVREQYKYSSVKANPSFFGFWPLARASDVEYITKYAARSKAVELLQSLCMLFHARKKYKILRSKRIYKMSVVRIQSAWRAILSRSKMQKMLENISIRWSMAVCIQCFIRCRFARLSMTNLRIERWSSKAPCAAVTIQSVFRTWKASTRFLRLLQIYRRDILIRERSSIIIQQMIRVYLAKCQIRKLKYEFVLFEKRLNFHALMIQSAYRCFKSYKVSEVLCAMRKLRTQSASIISCACRRFIFVRTLEEKVKGSRNRKNAATVIQSAVRAANAKKCLTSMVILVLTRKKENLIILLQSLWRRRIATLETQILLKQQKCLRERKEDKSILIRRWWRGQLGRKESKRRTQERLDRMRFEMQTKIWAATTISSAWRAKVAHNLVLSIRSDSERYKQGWKELYDEGSEKHFFYNQCTGETRWSKPISMTQALKQDSPVCSNCEYFKAHVECANCLEYFCGQCWDAVHFGGKRAHHQFRVLFDYYGRRIDYADEDFPSEWPSNYHMMKERI